MSDLQCAATFLLAGAGASEADWPGERVAAVLDGPVTAQDLGDLADLYRGETVLLRGPLPHWRELVTGQVGARAGGSPAGADHRGYRVEVDGDGWRVTPLG